MTCGGENRGKIVTAHCTNLMYPCPFYYVLIKNAQLGESKTLSYIGGSIFFCLARCC